MNLANLQKLITYVKIKSCKGEMIVEELTYYFLTFMLGSFLGVAIETGWCLLRYKRIESRKGVIFGPFNPLYGFAAITISFIANVSHTDNMGYFFLMGVVVSSMIEYVCSYWQEKVTGTVSWDYKDFKFNINGRINLIYSLAWGFLTIFWVKAGIPLVESISMFFYDKEAIIIWLFILMIYDCIISLVACIRRKQRKEKKYARTKLEKHFDYFYNDEVMEKVYANSKFIDN